MAAVLDLAAKDTGSHCMPSLSRGHRWLLQSRVLQQWIPAATAGLSLEDEGAGSYSGAECYGSRYQQSLQDSAVTSLAVAMANIGYWAQCWW